MNPDAIPSLARGMLDLFDDELRGVKFGDLDRSALVSRADEVRARAREVEAARSVLDEAQAALDDARTELTQLAERTLAYARIYAADRPDLGERLDAVNPSAAARPRRASKKRKGSAPELPFEAAEVKASKVSQVDKLPLEASPSAE